METSHGKTILVADDRADLRTRTTNIVSQVWDDPRIVEAATKREAVEIAERQGFDIAIIDYEFPGEGNGFHIARAVRARSPECINFLVTGISDGDVWKDAQKMVEQQHTLAALSPLDAAIRKPLDAPKLRSALDRIVAARDEWTTLRRDGVVEVGREPERHRMFGRSKAFNDFLEKLKQAAQVNRPRLVLQGETGTGKQLAASAFHWWSPRRDKNYVRCVVPRGGDSNSARSKLFGHERGAYTGADSRRLGTFELVEDGTLFVDEFQDLAISLPDIIEELKLALDTKNPSFERLGGGARIPFPGAVVVGLNRPFGELPGFPDDLRQRLGRVITLPPLREREGDAWLIAQDFGSSHGLQFSSDVEDFVSSYHWPGNVRQMENALQGMKAGSVVTADMLRGELSTEDLAPPAALGFSARAGANGAGRRPQQAADFLAAKLAYSGQVSFDTLISDLRGVYRDHWAELAVDDLVTSLGGDAFVAVRAIADSLFRRIFPDAGVVVEIPAGKDGTRPVWSNNRPRAVHGLYDSLRKERCERGLRPEWTNLSIDKAKARMKA